MCKHHSRGIIIKSAAVLGVGTIIDLAPLTVLVAIEYQTITVFNDSDRPIKVEWRNSDSSEIDYFYVPNGGKSYTHSIGTGFILPNSLIISSESDSVQATGNITINLSN